MLGYKLATSQDAQDYILGGRGTVTLESPSGVSKAYRMRPGHNDDTLYVLVKSDESWEYLGMLIKKNGTATFKLTKKSVFPATAPETKGFTYLLSMIENDTLESSPMVLYHEGRCGVCGRKLTNPESIKNGIGPICAGGR